MPFRSGASSGTLKAGAVPVFPRRESFTSAYFAWRYESAPRADADRDPSLMRLKANLIPRSIDPLRVVDIVGLDRQADGGTHVASTGEIGRVRVTKVQSKGRANKRVRIAVEDA